MTSPRPDDPLLAPRGSRAVTLLRFWDSAGMAILYLALFLLCALLIPNFLSRGNLTGLAQSIISVGIISCGMLFCLASGDFDLSVGPVAALSAIVAVMVTNHFTHGAADASPFPMLLGIPAGIAAGAIFGVVNGFLIAKLRINALITTLATMQIARGIAYIASGSKSIGSLNTPFNRLFGTRTFLSVPTPIWLLAGCMAVTGILLHLTVFGRKTLAIGGNAEAARYAGIDVARSKILIFTLMGALAALAGIVDASQLQNADPKAFPDLALAAISACVLGGVSLTGGIGTILAVIVGTLIMGTVQNAMNAKNVPGDYQYLITGTILLAAVLYDRLKQRLTR